MIDYPGEKCGGVRGWRLCCCRCDVALVCAFGLDGGTYERVPLALFRQKEPVDDASACANRRVSAVNSDGAPRIVGRNSGFNEQK